MSDPFVGEIRIFSFGWTPQHWAQCNGATLIVQQNAALYALIGTQFGGTPGANFNLPDLRGRVPVHQTVGYQQGSVGGAEAVSLTLTQMPAHTHTFYYQPLEGNKGGGNSTFALAKGKGVGTATAVPVFTAPANLVPMNAGTVAPQGAGQGHPNMQPFQVVNFCIALNGYFPSRN